MRIALRLRAWLQARLGAWPPEQLGERLPAPLAAQLPKLARWWSANRPTADRRGLARIALASVAAGPLVLLAAAGLGSVLVVLLLLAGQAAALAGVWWVLAGRRSVRVLALVVALGAPVAVVAAFAAANVLWAVALSALCWAVAGTAGRAALRADHKWTWMPQYEVPPPARPFLIMNPRSGGGKVERFGLVEKAEALGAEVHLLDTSGPPQDVAAIARKAVAEGADLLGVAGGDGTQALVAEVAAEHGIPFLVISAGTRNHFAMDLGLDRDDPSTCLDALTSDGVELRVDLGTVGGRVFVNNASFGAYAEVVQSPAYRDDKVRTTLDLLPDLLAGRRGARMTLRVDGAERAVAPQAILVSNNPYRTDDLAGLGGRERLDRGVLGVLALAVDTAAQATALLSGTFSPGLTVLTHHQVVIESDQPEIPVGVDGEALVMPTPVVCELRPAALAVRVPRHRPGVPPRQPRLDWRRLRELARGGATDGTTVGTAHGTPHGKAAATRLARR